jgi:hypothetical protein
VGCFDQSNETVDRKSWMNLLVSWLNVMFSINIILHRDNYLVIYRIFLSGMSHLFRWEHPAQLLVMFRCDQTGNFLTALRDSESVYLYRRGRTDVLRATSGPRFLVIRPANLCVRMFLVTKTHSFYLLWNILKNCHSYLVWWFTCKCHTWHWLRKHIVRYKFSR